MQGTRGHIGGAYGCARCGLQAAKFASADCPGTPFERATAANAKLEETGAKTHVLLPFDCDGELGVVCGVCGYHGSKLLRAPAKSCVGKADDRGSNNSPRIAEGKHPHTGGPLNLDWAYFRAVTGRDT